MKTLIVYYSLEGNTGYVVDKIAKATGADTLQLIPKKAYASKGFKKFLWGGKSAVMAEKPPLESYDVDLAQYDRIVFGFPVWAGNVTPPLRTFIAENQQDIKAKRVAAFACQSGSGAEKAFAKLKAAIGIESLETEAVFIDPKARRTDETDAAIEAFGQKLAE